MPFIQSSRRPLIRSNPALATQPGDLEFLIYEEMAQRWRSEPRWRTWRAIKNEMVQHPEDSAFLEALYSKVPGAGFPDVINAADAAAEVFFMEFVWPYEMDNKKINGGI